MVLVPAVPAAYSASYTPLELTHAIRQSVLRVGVTNLALENKESRQH